MSGEIYNCATSNLDVSGAQSVASLPPRNGSALQTLVISKVAAVTERTRFRIAREMVRAIADEQVDTLAGWWCVFNAREWPGDLGVEKPPEEEWAANFGRKLIESLLAKKARFGWRKLLRLAWRCYEDEKC